MSVKDDRHPRKAFPYPCGRGVKTLHQEIRPDSGEATALGAAFLAGLAVGFWRDKKELSALKQGQSVYKPSLNNEERKKLKQGWNAAVGSAKYFRSR